MASKSEDLHGQSERGGSTLARPYTVYVQVLTDPAGAPPDADQFERLMRALRGDLARELRFRGVWHVSPNLVGVFGWESWKTEGALEELAAECYIYIFVDRLRGLKAQLLVKPNINGLVRLDIRYFVHERQKYYDPLGFRVFDVLREAVKEAVSRSELSILAGDARILNGTLLGWRKPAIRARPSGLEGLVRSWPDGLFVALLLAKGAARRAVVDKLRARILGLKDHGIEAFQFGELIKPLKDEVRARWARAHGMAGSSSRPEEPAPSSYFLDEWEAKQDYFHLAAGIEEGMRGLELDAKTRRYLSKLWHYLRSQIEAPETGEGSCGSGEEWLSDRKLAEELQIPRERIPGLFEILQDLAAKARAPEAGRTPVKDRHDE